MNINAETAQLPGFKIKSVRGESKVTAIGASSEDTEAELTAKAEVRPEAFPATVSASLDVGERRTPSTDAPEDAGPTSVVMPVLAAGQSPTSVPPSDPAVFSKSPDCEAQPPIDRTVAVHNIKPDTEARELARVFRQLGKLCNAHIINSLHQDVERRSRGFGFVEFETAKAAAVVINS
jgi:hypothetical protein